MVAASQVDLRDQLGKIATPTLILAGADDQVTPPSDAEFLKAGIKGARLEVIADSAHNLTTEQPATVNAAVEKFLASLS
jgi:3-oxoadipate enol-lactonase/4-carboxymuconolactone decarboxylase